MAFDGNFLASLTDAERTGLAAEAERVTALPGATLVWRGEILSRLFFLESGRVEAKYRVRRSEAVLALGAGDFFGERALDDDATSDSRVRALEPCVAAAVPVESIRRLMAVNQSAARAFWQRVERRRIGLCYSFDMLGPCPSSTSR